MTVVIASSYLLVKIYQPFYTPHIYSFLRQKIIYDCQSKFITILLLLNISKKRRTSFCYR